MPEDGNYYRLLPYLKDWGGIDARCAIFSKNEFDNSQLLKAMAGRQTEYPQPDDDFGYREVTYNTKDYCPECGIGFVQKAPFRLKREIPWRKKGITLIHWVFDEFFVQRDIFEEVFRPLKIDSMPVLLKSGSVLKSTVQLVIPEYEGKLDMEGREYEICETCKRIRYEFIRDDFFPSFIDPPPKLDLFKANIYLGTGAQSYKPIIASQALRQTLAKLKINMDYIPMKF
jgi:hypothetical protein